MNPSEKIKLACHLESKDVKTIITLPFEMPQHVERMEFSFRKLHDEAKMDFS